MGSIVSDLFGGSKQSSSGTQQSQSSSDNQAYVPLSQTQPAVINNGVTASNAITGALTGTPQADNAFKNYLNSTGYNFQLQQGTNAIVGNNATKGILNSGATAKAVEGYGQNLAQQGFTNYLGQLQGQVTAGNQAGAVLSSAGGESKSASSGTTKSNGSSNNGILSSLF